MKKNILIWIIAVVAVLGIMAGVITVGVSLAKSSLEATILGANSQSSEMKQNFTVFNTSTIDTIIVPDTDLGADVGSASLRFNNIYGDNGYFGTIDASTGTIATLYISALATTTDMEVFGTLTTGPIHLQPNPGAMQVFNIPVTATSTAGTVHQALFQSGSSTIFAYSGTADGTTSTVSSTISLLATEKKKARVISAAGTFELGDNILNTDTSGAAFTVTLSDDWIGTGSATEAATAYICDYLGNAGTNAVTIDPESGTINGTTQIQITANYGCAVLQADGTNVRNLAQ